jgi:prepilin-type N-terminal cleavage/methylation domain-containing protein
MKSFALSKGFTLVEMVIVIVITGIVAAIGALIVNRGLSSYFTQKDITGVDQQGRLALERMTRELRIVRARTDLPSGVLSTSDITFTDTDGNSIRYCLGTAGGCPGTSGTSLMRNSQVLANNVTAFGLSYLTSTNTSTTDRNQVSLISIAVSVNQNTTTAGLRNTVSLRNLLP